MPTTEFLIWAAVAVLLASAIGFAAGFWYARLSAGWALQRARFQVAKLFQIVISTLEAAQQTCDFLERCPNLRLNATQVGQLDRKRSRLVESMANIIKRHQATLANALQDAQKRKRQKRGLVDIQWVSSPDDKRTGLPGRSAFEQNLNLLLKAGTEADQPSGLLMIKVDKADQLQRRFGRQGAENLLRNMAGVICRSVRGQDLVCQYSTDAFGILIPAIEPQDGRELAETIRNTVRQHKPQLGESGPEVLVTASFGFSSCRPNDSIDLVMSRANDALLKSQRHGRNQLHVYDDGTLVHCLAG